MVAENAVASAVLEADHNILQAESGLLDQSECGTLILDEMGNIRSCGTAACRLFGGNLADYMGKPISSLIQSLVLSNTSQSYSARYLAHLCADGGWRKVEAVDVMGREFAIEINLSLVETKTQGVYVLNVRRPKQNA